MWEFILNLLKGMGKSALMGGSSQPSTPTQGSGVDLMGMIRQMMGRGNGQ
jgi:hypothetical protein